MKPFETVSILSTVGKNHRSFEKNYGDFFTLIFTLTFILWLINRSVSRGVMMSNLTIKSLSKADIETALNLVWKVFLEFEAPDYTQEGIDEFYRSIHDEDYLAALSLYGAFMNEELVGIIATRSGGKHIALFFVDGKYHRQGIGKQLFQSVKTDKMTVNSSPYAVPVYSKFGFKPVNTEQVIKGLRFTPMAL